MINAKEYAELLLSNADELEDLGYNNMLTAMLFTEQKIVVDKKMHDEISDLQAFYEKELKIYRKFNVLDTLLISIYHLLGDEIDNILINGTNLFKLFKENDIYKSNISRHKALIVSSMISTEKEVGEFIDKSKTFSEVLRAKKISMRGNELTVLSAKSAESLASDKMESRCILEQHPFFKPGLIIKDSSSWLNLFFALGEDLPGIKCKKYFDTIDMLNQNGYSFNKKYVEECFGLFAMVNAELETLVKSFVEIDKYLKESEKIEAETDRIKYSTILTVNMSIYNTGKNIKFRGYPIDDTVLISRYLEEWINIFTLPPSDPDHVGFNASNWANC